MNRQRKQLLFGKPLTTPWPNSTQIRHWNQILRALRARLINRDLAVGPPQAGQPTHASSKPVPDFSVRECVAALDEMHKALQRETAQRQELEHAYQHAQSALQKAEADLDLVTRREHRARHMALHDELTALPNRRQLLEQLSGALAKHESHNLAFSVLYIDLDGFKGLNDRFGHCVGDEVLRITAARLRGAVRHDDLVVRVGGDEFICLLRGMADMPPLRQVCHKLVQTVSTPMKIGTQALLVHPSIGIAIYPHHATTAVELIACADSAMYAAKRKGCGFAFHESAG